MNIHLQCADRLFNITDTCSPNIWSCSKYKNSNLYIWKERYWEMNIFQIVSHSDMQLIPILYLTVYYRTSTLQRVTLKSEKEPWWKSGVFPSVWAGLCSSLESPVWGTCCWERPAITPSCSTVPQTKVQHTHTHLYSTLKSTCI